MNQIEKAISQIAIQYDNAQEKAWNAYSFAKKYGKKAEQLEAKKAWEQAFAVVVAVDQALDQMRVALEEKVGA
jgi:hypothetical protein